MRRINLRLVGVSVLAAILRCLFLHSRGIQYDDAFSIFLSRKSLAEIVSGTAADTMPPLYYFLLHFWGLVSQELWWLRLLSVLLSLGCVALLYLLVRRLASEGAAQAAALLAAISPLQIYHAQDLRMYALTACAVLGYWYFFTRLWQGWERQSVADWAGFILCGAAALYAHNLAGFLLLPPFAFLIWRRAWKQLLRFAVGGGVILLLFSPWLLLLPGQVEKIQRAFWTPKPGMVEIVQAILLGAGNLPLPSGWMGVALVCALGGLTFVVIGLVRGRKELNEITFLAWAAGLPPLLLLILSYPMRPVFVPRGFLAAYLALDGLAAWIIWRAWQPGGGKIIFGLFLLSAVISLPTQYTFDVFPRSPFKAAMQDLSSQLREGDIILHDNKLSYFPAEYYVPNLPQRFLADEPGSANDTYALGSQKAMQLIPAADLPAGTAGASRVFFVFFTQTRTDYLSAGLVEHPVLAWLDEHGHLDQIQAWNDLNVYIYTMER